MFLFDFLTYYTQFSIMCLIKDIFNPEINIIKYDSQTTIDLYKSSTTKNIENFFNLIPFFVILEIVYSYSEEYNYFKTIFQLFFEIYFSFFISLVITYYRDKSKKENSKLICTFNILQYNALDIYLDFLMPVSFLPFTIGLNKLTIDITFYSCLLYYFFKNSNVSMFVNAVEVCESHLKIKEFNGEISRMFGLLSKKYSQFSNREGFNIDNKNVENKEE